MSTLLNDSYISYVNLDHRKDRRLRMEQTLRQQGIIASRTRGMLPHEYTGDPVKVKRMRDRTPGAIGCHYSQVAVMREALCQGKHAFVMEDDLVFCRDFPKRLDMIEAFMAKNEWDVIWLGGTFHINPPYWHKALGRDAELTSDPHMVRTYGAFCTYAYLVNRNSLDAILNLLEEGVSDSIGIDYLFIQIQPQLKTYAFVPGCITQYDNKSDIGTGMTIFSGFKKLGPYWFQDHLGNWDPATFNWHEANI